MTSEMRVLFALLTPHHNRPSPSRPVSPPQFKAPRTSLEKPLGIIPFRNTPQLSQRLPTVPFYRILKLGRKVQIKPFAPHTLIFRQAVKQTYKFLQSLGETLRSVRRSVMEYDLQKHKVFLGRRGRREA